MRNVLVIMTFYLNNEKCSCNNDLISRQNKKLYCNNDLFFKTPVLGGGGDKLGYAQSRPVEKAVAVHLCPSRGRKSTSLPSKPCRATAHFTERRYTSWLDMQHLPFIQWQSCSFSRRGSWSPWTRKAWTQSLFVSCTRQQTSPCAQRGRRLKVLAAAWAA